MPYIIYIKSFTSAQKAHNYLQKHNIRTSLSRTSVKGKGCGFALKIVDNNTDKAEVCALLNQIGVPCDIP